MSRAPEFHEDWQSDHIDPVDGHANTFDYEAIDEHLSAESSSTATPEESTDFDFDAVDKALGSNGDTIDEETMTRLTTALVLLVRWICDVSLRKGADAVVGRRAIALAWVLRPEIFNGQSLSALAAQLGTKKMNLSRWTAEFSRVFHLRNRGQSHGWNYSAEYTPRPPKRQPKPKPEGNGDQLTLL